MYQVCRSVWLLAALLLLLNTPLKADLEFQINEVASGIYGSGH